MKPIELPEACEDVTDLERAFVLCYMENGFRLADAYRAASNKPELSVASARSAASSLMCKTRVKAFLQFEIDKLVNDKEQLARKILGDQIAIATTDVNELVEHRRGACRYCYGQDHRYQFTNAEWERLVEDYMHKCQEATDSGLPLPPEINLRGGLGYDRRKEPNTDCPECFGDGVSQVFVKDSRDLGVAAALFAGVKRTKDGGVEMMIQDKSKAQLNLARHLNLFEKDKEAGAGEIHIHLDEKDKHA